MERPLEGVDGVHETVIDYSIYVRSAPGYLIFIGAMHNARMQWTPIEPDRLTDVLKALRKAASHARIEVEA